MKLNVLFDNIPKILGGESFRFQPTIRLIMYAAMFALGLLMWALIFYKIFS